MATIPNHLDIVKAARARYAALAVPERAHRIVNAVAWELRDEGAGLFLKTGGTRFADRSIDVIIFKGGETSTCSRTPKGGGAVVVPHEADRHGRSQEVAGRCGSRARARRGVCAPEPSNPALDVTAEIKAIRGALDALIARLERD